MTYMTDKHGSPFSSAVSALEYMSAAVHAGDDSALHFAAFVWAQRGDYILRGEETWHDQSMPPIVLGGGDTAASQRVRKVRKDLPPPQAGEPFVSEESKLGDEDELRRIAAHALSKLLRSSLRDQDDLAAELADQLLEMCQDDYGDARSEGL